MKYGFKQWMREDKRNERHVGQSEKSGPSSNMNYAMQHDDDDEKESMFKRGKAMVERGKLMMQMAGSKNEVGEDPEKQYGENAGYAPKIGNATNSEMAYSGRMKKGNVKRTAFKKKMQKKYESMMA